MEYDIVSRDEFESFIKNVPVGAVGAQVYPPEWEVLVLEGSELLKNFSSNGTKYQAGMSVTGWFNIKNGIWVPLRDIFAVAPDYVLKPDRFDTSRVRKPRIKKPDGDKLISFFFPKPQAWFPDRLYYGEINKTLNVRAENGGKIEVKANHKDPELLLSLQVLSEEYKNDASVLKLKLMPHELACAYEELYCAIPRSEVFLFQTENDEFGFVAYKVYYPSGHKEKVYKKE